MQIVNDAKFQEAKSVSFCPTYPTTKLQAQFNWEDTPMATATYLPENISATINQGIGPRL